MRRSSSVRGRRSRPGIFGKRIYPGAPSEVLVDVATEGLGEGVPGDLLRWATEGRSGHLGEAGVGQEANHLVPDGRHLAMEHVRIVVQRTPPNSADEPIDDRVVDLAGIDFRQRWRSVRAARGRGGGAWPVTAPSTRPRPATTAFWPGSITGARPLCRTAARKSERTLASVFAVMPTATGLIVASRAAILNSSSGRWSGLLAEKCPQRGTPPSAGRGGASPKATPCSPRARSTSASVGTTGFGGIAHVVLFLFPSGVVREVSGGLGRTTSDLGGHSGKLPYHRWDVCLMGVFPNSRNALTWRDIRGLGWTCA